MLKSFSFLVKIHSRSYVRNGTKLSTKDLIVLIVQNKYILYNSKSDKRNIKFLSQKACKKSCIKHISERNKCTKKKGIKYKSLSRDTLFKKAYSSS